MIAVRSSLFAAAGLTIASLTLVSCASSPREASAKGKQTEWTRANLPDGHVVLTSKGSSAAYDTKGKAVVVQNGTAILSSAAKKPLKVLSWGLEGEVSGQGQLAVKQGESITAVCSSGSFKLRFPGSTKAPITLSAGKAATVTLKKRS